MSGRRSSSMPCSTEGQSSGCGEAGNAPGAGRPRREPLAEAARARRSRPRRRRSPRRGAPARGSPTPALSSGRARVAASRRASRRPRAAVLRRPPVGVALASQLGEPGAVLGDEVDCEAVAAGRHRGAHGDLQLDLLAGRYRPRERRAHAVPDDRVPSLVEPVVRGRDVRSPCRGADVLDVRPRRRQRAGPQLAASDQDPHRATSGAGTALVYARARAAPRSRLPPRGRSSARPCGSCARRGVRFPSTGRCESVTASSSSPGRRSSARR